MHYWPLVDAKPGSNWNSATVYDVSLIAWRRRGTAYTPPDQATDENAFVMYGDAAKGPSRGDVLGIKYIYP
jgi:hypothetical protein